MAHKFLNIGGLAAFALAAGLAGCSGGTLSGLASVKPPQHNDIQAEYVAFVTQWNGMPTNDRAKEYVTRGYDLADKSCVIYFAKLKQLRNETTFIKDTLTTLFAAGGVIAGLSGVAAPVLVGIFAAGGLVPNTIQNVNNVYLLAEFGDDLYPSISQSMAKFRATHPADGSPPVPSKPEDKENDALQVSTWTAQQLVQQYASLCSLPAMTSMVNAGVANLQWTLNADGTVGVTKAPPAK